MKSIKKIQLLSKVIFRKNARFLLQYQKCNALDQSSSNDSDNDCTKLPTKLTSKNLFVKLGAYLQIKKLVSSYQRQQLSDYDKKLFLGVFCKEEKELFYKKEKTKN